MPEDVDRYELQRLRADGAAVVEVLPRSEFESEHLPGAISLPLGQLRPESAEQHLGADRHRAVVVYCQSVDWDLSSRAAWRLETLGYTRVYRYFAGKTDWLASGLPTEGKDAGEPRIGALAHRDTPTCRPGQRIGDLHLHGDLCAVTTDNGIVLGDLRGKALKASPESRVEQVMDPAPSTYRPNVSVHQMLHEMLESKAKRVLVTDGDGRLMGWLSVDDVQAALQHQEQPGDGPVLAPSH